MVLLVSELEHFAVVPCRATEVPGLRLNACNSQRFSEWLTRSGLRTVANARSSGEPEEDEEQRPELSRYNTRDSDRDGDDNSGRKTWIGDTLKQKGKQQEEGKMQKE
ncbi:hypothetical protein Nepgr_015085 [Nepenthes gracilis]|uniref:Uncharacterized protein n=1 Tax=Nepenthes gracilis TaxID=150966 RepID=A0AAD3XQT3_NEPGR|nr:hypothetical protein Nepgr_015085 [Nepenthes gracilis]